MAGPRFAAHPLVEKLTAHTKAGDQVRLVGYFGGTAEGVVKVYPSLDDLSVYYEIREEDILAVEDAAPEELPHDGSAIWVKGDARIERCVDRRTSVEARFLAGGIAAKMAPGPAVRYGAAARVAVEPETAGGAGCEYTQVWPCSALVGVCLASNDMPCAYTDAYWCMDVATLESCLTCAGYTCVRECYSVMCPPTQRFCTGFRATCVCQVWSRDVCPDR
jgi:hypothetical protein